MIRRQFDAIVIDLDGTLLDDTERIPEGTLATLRAAHGAGVRVMVATGRSELATEELLAQLDFDTLAVVYNGAGVYCPRTARMVEERVLSERTARQALDLAREESLLVVTMRAGEKRSIEPRDDVERAALRGMHGLRTVRGWDLPTDRLMRITYFSGREASDALQSRVRAAVRGPVYLTSFPLSMLVAHRTNPLAVVDLHPPCRGKAESLRVLEEAYGIPPERVVAVGDADNDLPMIEAAGLGVAMQRATPAVLRAARRVIGDNNTDTIGRLVAELFGVAVP